MRRRGREKAREGMEIVAQASATPFLVKLWAMLADDHNSEAIVWRK